MTKNVSGLLAMLTVIFTLNSHATVDGNISFYNKKAHVRMKRMIDSIPGYWWGLATHYRYVRSGPKRAIAMQPVEVLRFAWSTPFQILFSPFSIWCCKKESSPV